MVSYKVSLVLILYQMELKKVLVPHVIQVMTPQTQGGFLVEYHGGILVGEHQSGILVVEYLGDILVEHQDGTLVVEHQGGILVVEHCMDLEVDNSIEWFH